MPGAVGVVGAVAVALAVLWGVPTEAEMVAGRATYYRAGLMEEVAANRGVDLGPWVGGVALNRAGDLGRVVWLEWDARPGQRRGDLEGPFWVVDCAGEGGDFVAREEGGLVVEVDYGVAERRGFAGVGPVGVRVWFEWPWGRRMRDRRMEE